MEKLTPQDIILITKTLRDALVMIEDEVFLEENGDRVVTMKHLYLVFEDILESYKNTFRIQNQ